MIRIPHFALAPTLPARADALCICLKCLSGGFRHLEPLSEAMSPALPPGTCLAVAVRAPDGLPTDAGQIISFGESRSGALHVFRPAAGPGQTVQMKGGVLWIDGQPTSRQQIGGFAQPMRRNGSGGLPRCPLSGQEEETCTIARLVETLPNGTACEVLEIEESGSSDWTELFSAPEGHVFVPGDNRENAADSRLPQQTGGRGFVPIADITGSLAMILHE